MSRSISERWRIIRSNPNYLISSNGRVKNITTNKILKHQHSARGGNYAFVDLRSNGHRRVVNVHILVATAFLGPTPDGHIVHHEDHNRLNPALDNLSFETHSDNNRK